MIYSTLSECLPMLLRMGTIHSSATNLLDSVHGLSFGIEGDIAIKGFITLCGCVYVWVL